MEWKQLADKYMNQSFFPNFEDQNKAAGPHINLYESEHELLCVASLPGLKNMDDVEVYVYQNAVKLIGNTSFHIKGMSIRQNEIYQGRFEREISLPYSVREDPIDAYYRKGLLCIRLYRLLTDERKKKKVEIKNEDE